MKNSILGQVTAAVLVFALSTTVTAQKKEDKADMVKQIKELAAANAQIAKNLETFDTLDYQVFSNQEWSRLHESHSKNIKFHSAMCL